MTEQKALKKAIQKVGKKVVEQLQKELLLANKKATGNLLNSLDYELVRTPNGYELKIVSAPYLKFIETGRGAGKPEPPTNKIISWVKARRIRFVDYKTNKPMTAEQTGFIIAKSIHHKGIAPSKVLTKTRAKVLLNAGMISDIMAGVRSDLQELIDKTFRDVLAKK